MWILLNTGIYRLTIKIFIGVAEFLWYVVFFLTAVQILVHFLQLIHQVIYNYLTIHLHLLTIIGQATIQHQVSEFLYHEELLNNWVDIAYCS